MRLRFHDIAMAGAVSAFVLLASGCGALGLNAAPTPDVPGTVTAQVGPSVVAQVQATAASIPTPLPTPNVPATVSAGVQATVQSIPTQPISTVYSPEIVQDFMDACTRSGGQNRQAVCGCSIQRIEARYTAAEFARIATQMQNGQGLPSDLLQIVTECTVSPNSPTA